MRRLASFLSGAGGPGKFNGSGFFIIAMSNFYLDLLYEDLVEFGESASLSPFFRVVLDRGLEPALPLKLGVCNKLFPLVFVFKTDYLLSMLF